jgi:uncharacterized damage-inducible protein DinB
MTIRTKLSIFPLLTLTLALASGIAVAAPPAPAANARTTGAVQADLLAALADADQKILELEEAVPQSKFDWRPAPGVRSIAEVYLHIAFGNYNMIRIATGKAPPADAGFALDRGKWDTQTTDKAKIKAILQKSFAFAHDALQTLPDADLDKKVEFFGHPMTARAVLLRLVGHDNEHLGQSIAYARANNVIPPWSKGQK